MFSLDWDPVALAEIAQLIGFANLLNPEVQSAMQEAANTIVQQAQQNTWDRFKHPDGQLADSLHPLMRSPYEIEVGSDDPKARRREQGFSGMTDSLGRFYPNDPGVFYLRDALAESGPDVLGLLSQAVQDAFAQVGGG